MQPGGIVESLRPADTSIVRLRVSTASLTGRAEVTRDDIVMETEADGTEDCAYVSVPAFTIQLLPNAAAIDIVATATDRTCRNFAPLAEAVFFSSIQVISIASIGPNGYLPWQTIVYQFGIDYGMQNLVIRLI